MRKTTIQDFNNLIINILSYQVYRQREQGFRAFGTDSFLSFINEKLYFCSSGSKKNPIETTLK